MIDESRRDNALIVVNFGDPSLIAENLVSSHESGTLVVVVDNFHSPQARAATAALCEDNGWVYVASPNDGFGAGVNRGLLAARARGCRTFTALNPDAIASPEVIRELARHVAAHPDDLVSPYMDTSDGRPHFRGIAVSMRTGQMRSGWNAADDDPEWKNWLSGACLAFSDAALDRLGGFSEEFFLYWEDVDISRRAAALGLRLVVRSDLVVVHDEGGTHQRRGSRAKSPVYYYYNIRNRLLFGRRMLSGRAWARWVLHSPRQSLLIWMRGGRKQALTDPRGVIAALRGLGAGLAQVVRQPQGSDPGTVQRRSPWNTTTGSPTP